MPFEIIALPAIVFFLWGFYSGYKIHKKKAKRNFKIYD
ncbi:hypothetical protein PBAC_17310 [Pedobacter glucosidilyticus]|nr:hypothetical protein PBAC_17310 [Pedobacter glucosidilyticus]